MSISVTDCRPFDIAVMEQFHGFAGTRCSDRGTCGRRFRKRSFDLVGAVRIEQARSIRAPLRDYDADLSAAHLPSAGPALACNVRSTNMQLPSQSLRTGNKQVQVRKTTR